MPEIRAIKEDEIPDYRQAISAGFGGDARDGDDEIERFRALFPLETCLAAFDRGRIVATFGSFDLDLTVPGGSLPMAGTTIVTVHPAYRRRGLLTSMMKRHLEQAVERGQRIAGLWTSETAIYGRFGYGIAAEGYDFAVDASKVAIPPGPEHVTLRPIDLDAASELLPPVYDEACRATPGFFARRPEWWKGRNLHDPEHWRGGASAKRIVVAEVEGAAAGYVMYRQKEKWEGFVSSGKVDVIELVALDDHVRHSLWHFLLEVDLFPNVEYWNMALDDPLIDLVDNRRGLDLKLFDRLWLRLLDVPTALETRSYESDGSIRLGVTDGFMDRADSYSLQISGGEAACVATEEPPDVTMDVAVLGSIYLGGFAALRLHRSGSISGSEDDVRRLGSMFRTARSPHAIEVF